jgi:hypothetical protein
MELSTEAKKELETILKVDLNSESFEQLTEGDVEEIGIMLLKLTSLIFKRS